MSAFEDFIQTELPKRPWSPDDPAQESIPVRRGVGPRQLDFIELNDDEVLGKVAGEVKGVPIPGISTICSGYEHTQLVASNSWVVNHAGNTKRIQITIYDATDNVILPDEITLTDNNNITVTFTEPQDGRAILILF